MMNSKRLLMMMTILMVVVVVVVVECSSYKGHIRISSEGSLSSYMEGPMRQTVPNDYVKECSSCHDCACGVSDRYSSRCESCSQCLSEFVYSCQNYQTPSTSSCNCVNVCQNVSTHQTQTQSQNASASFNMNITCISECTFSVGQGVYLNANCTGDTAANSTSCVQSFSANLSNCARKECGASSQDLEMIKMMAPIIIKGYSNDSHMKWLSSSSYYNMNNRQERGLGLGEKLKETLKKK